MNIPPSAMALIDLHERDVDKWTLRLVIERGALAFECRNCWHLAQVDVLGLIERFGADAVVGHTRASGTMPVVPIACKVHSLVRLKIGRTDLAWVPVPPRIGR